MLSLKQLTLIDVYKPNSEALAWQTLTRWFYQIGKPNGNFDSSRVTPGADEKCCSLVFVLQWMDNSPFGHSHAN